MNIIFITFFIIIIIELLIIFILLSNMNFDIDKCYVQYNNQKQKFEILDLKIILKIRIFKELNLLKIIIYKDYCEIFNKKIEFNYLKNVKDENENPIFFIIRNFRKLNTQIDKFDLNLKIGTEDIFFTTFLVPIISSGIALLIRDYLSLEKIKEGRKNFDFKIQPIYPINNISIINLKLILNLSTIKFIYFTIKHYKNRKTALI